VEGIVKQDTVIYDCEGAGIGVGHVVEKCGVCEVCGVWCGVCEVRVVSIYYRQ
jgi:hypothetical protein